MTIQELKTLRQTEKDFEILIGDPKMQAYIEDFKARVIREVTFDLFTSKKSIENLLEKRANELQASLDTAITNIPVPKDGHTYTKEELVEIILPLIPAPIHGKTPTREELVKIVRPLIPEATKEQTAITKEELRKMITEMIPKIEQGISDTALQIADKLNTLKEAVNVEVIRDLKKWMLSMERTLRQKKGGKLGGHGGDGGAGSSDTPVDNEVVSGSGTSWTLANTPIAGTVHVYGRGQRLKLTTTYSISGTTITTVDSWIAGEITADYKK